MSESREQLRSGTGTLVHVMRPPDDVCYQAILSRDARFDGWFYVGVTSTCIYCRPSCPARTPRREHVTFHASAASAQAAGYRACKRCRPDATPGSPAWNTRADVAGRALRLIGDGLVDRDGVAGLAERLGYSARQVQRTLIAEVGAGPLALARAQRAQNARILLETTDIATTDVAFAAGFGSVRQFNDTVRTVFAATPTQLRELAARGGTAGAASGWSADPSVLATGSQLDGLSSGPIPGPAEHTVPLRLAYRPPMDLGALLGFLRARAVPGNERADDDGGFSAVLSAAHGPVLVRITAHPSAAAGARAAQRVAPAISCDLTLHDVRDLSFAVARVRALLDLDADPVEVDRLLGSDPSLAASVAQRPGLRSPGALDGFGLAVRAIVGQQVSVAGARTVLGRIVDSLGETVTFRGEKWRRFPDAATLADAEPTMFPLPQARIRTIHALARVVADGELVLDPGADRAHTHAQLMALPGIGRWTADYIVMRALGDPNVLLDTDLVLKRALASVGLVPAERWAPWRSYATHHLWRASTPPPTPAAEPR